jgi:hypothetical protein
MPFCAWLARHPAELNLTWRRVKSPCAPFKLCLGGGVHFAPNGRIFEPYPIGLAS